MENKYQKWPVLDVETDYFLDELIDVLHPDRAYAGYQLLTGREPKPYTPERPKRKRDPKVHEYRPHNQTAAPTPEILEFWRTQDEARRAVEERRRLAEQREIEEKHERKLAEFSRRERIYALPIRTRKVNVGPPEPPKHRRFARNSRMFDALCRTEIKDFNNAMHRLAALEQISLLIGDGKSLSDACTEVCRRLNSPPNELAVSFSAISEIWKTRKGKTK